MEAVTNFASSFVFLFFSKKHGSHRVIGLAFLIQFFASLILYCRDYEMFARSCLWWSMPITGVIQALNAVNTFTFLPKKQVDPGYYSDKSTMSYRFIYENIFYETILAFQWLYMDKGVYSFLLSSPYFGGFIEALFVFLPYTCIREPFFPKTHFRDSMNNKANKTDKNQQFYAVFTQLTAVFYLFAKHYIGYMLNYMRFMDLIPADMIYSIHFMLIAAQAATTIAMFLHTLKFKGYISGRLSFMLYVISYSLTVVSWVGMRHVIFLSPQLILIALVGLLLNRYSNRTFHVYQIILTVWFFNQRYAWLDVTTIESGFEHAFDKMQLLSLLMNLGGVKMSM